MNCSLCGAYIPAGDQHSCTGYPTYPATYSPTYTLPQPTPATLQPWFDNGALQRIAVALERIAEALKPAVEVTVETQANEVNAT